MRLWSEEKKLGTIELLMTLPVNSVQAVLGKFAAGLTFLGFTLAMTFPLPLAVFWLGNPDPGPILGGYLGSLALGMVYLSIGSFASTLSRDQIVAFIIGGVLCAFFWLTGWEPFVASLSDFSQLLGAFVAALGIDTHFYGISRGVLDTRDVIYALSVTAFFLYLNVIMVERKR
jgi:ABC-2 type transport system permease protein